MSKMILVRTLRQHRKALKPSDPSPWPPPCPGRPALTQRPGLVSWLLLRTGLRTHVLPVAVSKAAALGVFIYAGVVGITFSVSSKRAGGGSCFARCLPGTQGELHTV